MKKTTINLLDNESSNFTPPAINEPTPRHHWRRTAIISGLTALVLMGVLFIVNIVIPSARLSKNFGSNGIFTQIKHLTFSGDRTLASENQDRINLLFMGIGGNGHEGPLLADTIIIASIERSTGRVALMSAPRDLLIPYPDGSWKKINEIYAVGETKNPNEGGKFAARTVSTVLGIPIPYYVLIDFNGFEQLINAVGGIDVNVERSFSDPLFPALGAETETDYNNRYENITFTAGWQHMDGKTALKFARSRHGNNGEGSDFARSKRQQKILLALKDQILDAQVLLNPITINRLASKLTDNLETNLEPWQALRLYQLTKNINTEQVIRITLDDSPRGLLISAINGGGAYVLQPRNGDYSIIQKLARNIFNNPELVQEPAKVEVLNGTGINGLASKMAKLLAEKGYYVVRIANAETKNSSTTMIHDFSYGKRPTSLAALRILLEAKIATSIPDWLISTATTIDPNAKTFEAPARPNSGADFVIIIGADNILKTETEKEKLTL